VALIEGTQLAEVVGAVASTGEAREVLAGLPVDVVFVDVQLPGDESGLELVQSLATPTPQAVSGYAFSPRPSIVLATAFSEHALQAFDLGVVDYLMKPFSEERVEQCLRRILQRRLANATGLRRA
jgi:DNA-binding LytR/AlgR family response regulator